MWEIYAYQNADSLFGVFNAAASIHASGDYMSAVAAVAFCGFVAALIAYAFAPEKLQGWKWLGTVLLVFSILILPKTTVGIVDKTGSAPVKVVANVPFGMVMLGSVTSTTVGASLSPDSASSAPVSRLGSGTTRSTEKTAAASVGEVTAPRSTASSQGSPST